LRRWVEKVFNGDFDILGEEIYIYIYIEEKGEEKKTYDH